MGSYFCCCCCVCVVLGLKGSVAEYLRAVAMKLLGVRAVLKFASVPVASPAAAAAILYEYLYQMPLIFQMLSGRFHSSNA